MKVLSQLLCCYLKNWDNDEKNKVDPRIKRKDAIFLVHPSRPWSAISRGHGWSRSRVEGCVLCYHNKRCSPHSSWSELSYLRLGREVDGAPSGIAEREDTVIPSLELRSEEVEDDGEGDTKLRDDRLLGFSSTFSAPNPGGIFEDRWVDPVWQKL